MKLLQFWLSRFSRMNKFLSPHCQSGGQSPSPWCPAVWLLPLENLRNRFFVQSYCVNNEGEKVTSLTTPNSTVLIHSTRKMCVIFSVNELHSVYGIELIMRIFLKDKWEIFMFVPCINNKHFIIQQMHKYIIRRYN